MSNQGAPHQPAAVRVGGHMEHGSVQVCTNSLIGQNSNYHFQAALWCCSVRASCSTNKPCAQGKREAGKPQHWAEPSAAAAAAAAQRGMRALVPRLWHLHTSVSRSLGCSPCTGFDGGRQARQLMRLVMLLQPYIADDAPAIVPERPGELASVHSYGPCEQCMLLELLRRLRHCASPLPLAPLHAAVETVYQANANEVFHATGAPGKHA